MAILKQKDPAYTFLLHHKYKEPYWVVKLSNGETVYQSDYWNGLTVNSWLDLQVYCDENKLIPIGMQLEYYDHVIKMKDHSDGYFFRRGVIAELISQAKFDAVVIGDYDKRTDLLNTWMYKLPELHLFDYDYRDAKKRIETKCDVGNSFWLI